MKRTNRIFVYVLGFMIGIWLVSVITNRRGVQREAGADPWLAHNAEAINVAAEPLPQAVPAVIRAGTIVDFGYLPNKLQAQSKVWHVNFDQSYPYVRVVEDLSSGVFSYMAADQIVLKLADGVDVTALKPMLDDLGLRLRMFNRKDHIAVVGVLTTRIDAVPATIKAIWPYSDLFKAVDPDIIEFK